MICDKITFKGQTILTVYHKETDTDFPQRVIRMTQKFGRFNLTFIETFSDDTEAEKITGWIVREEGIVPQGKSINNSLLQSYLIVMFQN